MRELGPEGTSDGGTHGCCALWPLVAAWAETRSGLHPVARAAGLGMCEKAVCSHPTLSSVCPRSGRKRSCGRTGSVPGGEPFPLLPRQREAAVPSHRKPAAGSPRSTRRLKASRRHMAPAAAQPEGVCHHTAEAARPSRRRSLQRRQVTIWPGRGGEAGRPVRLTAWWPGSQL